MLSTSQYRYSREHRTTLVSGPIAEPVSITDFQNYLQLKGETLDSTIVYRRIKSSRELIENQIRRCYVQQTWNLVIDSINQSYDPLIPESWSVVAPIDIPKPPLLYIQGVYLTSIGNVETLADPSTYLISTDSIGRITLNYGSMWNPTRRFSGFRVQFSCGYLIPITVTDSIFTANNSGLADGTVLRYHYTAASPIAELWPDSGFNEANFTLPLYVLNPSDNPNSFQLSLTPGGSPITIATDVTTIGHFLTKNFPENLREALLITATQGMRKGLPSGGTKKGESTSLCIPEQALEKLAGYTVDSIAF